jgi:hypothetical protein
MTHVYSPTVVVKVTGLTGLRGVKGENGEGSALRLETIMQSGVLTYTLPSFPAPNSTLAFINGVQVSHIVSGVNLTITGYTAGEIEDDDELKIYY